MPAGRPTDCTEAVIVKTEAAALAGVSMRNLWRHAGVDQTTFWRWMSATEGIQAEFSQRIQKARCAKEVGSLLRGDDEGRTFDMWLLERSYGYRKDADSDTEPVMASARTREEAVAQLAKLPVDLLREALDLTTKNQP
jgi:hypothetical protein